MFAIFHATRPLEEILPRFYFPDLALSIRTKKFKSFARLHNFMEPERCLNMKHIYTS
jgi:hypothetical protein